jgi:hypothetical protein
VESVLAQNASEFPEGKERNEDAKYDDAAGEKFVEVYFVRQA